MSEAGADAPSEYCAHFLQLARYNRWMNERVYGSAARLTPEALALERGAFFGSIVGTLNHLVAADTIWLKRFLSHPAGFRTLDPVLDLPRPMALAETVFATLPELHDRRRLLDRVIVDWCGELTEKDLALPFAYENMRGEPARRRFSGVLAHFFNHQTHHRGQASTLLFQAGEDVGITDLLPHIPEEPGD